MLNKLSIHMAWIPPLAWSRASDLELIPLLDNSSVPTMEFLCILLLALVCVEAVAIAVLLFLLQHRSAGRPQIQQIQPPAAQMLPRVPIPPPPPTVLYPRFHDPETGDELLLTTCKTRKKYHQRYNCNGMNRAVGKSCLKPCDICCKPKERWEVAP